MPETGRVAIVTAASRGIGAACARELARFEEVARVVAWLLSDEASFVTGAHVKVDGGSTRAL